MQVKVTSAEHYRGLHVSIRTPKSANVGIHATGGGTTTINLHRLTLKDVQALHDAAGKFLEEAK